MRHRNSSIFGSFYRSILLFLIVLTLAGWAGAQNLTINPGLSTLEAGDSTTLLGLSSATYTGLASGLVMKVPGKLAMDSAGNLYEIETSNNIVRVVAASSNSIPVLPGVTPQAGHVYTVAGTTGSATAGVIPCTGGIDKQGNGCPATQAFVVSDSTIAVDGNSNLYIADGTNKQIRVVYGGKGTLPGVASPIQGYIYALTNVANSTSTTESGINGPATAATLKIPYPAMAVDSNGNVYILEGTARHLLLIYAGGTLPTNFIPSGATPTPGYIYLLSANPVCTSTASAVCDGEPVASARFSAGIGAMAADPSGNLYIEDSSYNTIRAVYVAGSLPGVSNPVAGDIYRVAGNGTSGISVNGSSATSVSLNLSGSQGGIAFDSAGAVYFTTVQSSLVKGSYANIDKVDPSGILTTIFGGVASCEAPMDTQNDGCAATAVSNALFTGLAVDSAGNLYGASSQTGTGPYLIFKSNVSTSALYFPGTIGITAATQTLYVSNTGTQPLVLSNIAFNGPFEPLTTGSNNCSSSTTLTIGESCQIEVSFLPTESGAATGTLTISSNTQNGGVNTVTLAGNAAKASSTTVLITTPGYPSIANVNQPITLTAKAIPQYQDTLTPSGAVTFMNGTATLGTANIVNGVATMTASSGFAAGTYTLTAVYSGDSNFNTSTSSPATVNVSSTPVAVVTLTPSATSSISGQSMTLTATAAAFSGTGVPTGSITFQVGGSPLPGGTATLSNGTATLTTTALPPGTDNLVAVYSGDSNFGTNVSAPVPVVVASAAQLQFSPGIISRLSGSYFTTSSTAIASGSAATSAQYPSNSKSLAVDSYGNTYVIAGQLYVTASGNGPIPGVTSPAAGNIYLIGTGGVCSSTSKPCGDGGPVGAASFGSLGAIAVDAMNNIYVADKYVVRKISAATGVINTIAGVWNGTTYGAYSGDGGPATSANIHPTAFAADQNGNLFIADNYYYLVHEVNGQTGIISTVAGTIVGAGTYTGSGAANQCTALPCGDGGLATAATLNAPTAIYVDQADNIYIVDNGNYNEAASGTPQVVRKVNAQSGLINLFAGQYEEGAYEQQCGASGDISCGDGGPATSAVFDNITGISGDQAGDIYVSDSTLATIREVNGQTGIIQTVVGTATGAGGGTNECTSGNAPCGDSGLATSAELNSPQQIALDQQGNIYVIDKGTDVVRVVTGATTTLAYGSQTLGTLTPQTVTVTNTGLQPLVFSGFTVPLNYLQQSSGGVDCTSTISLAPGYDCDLDIAFFPTATGALPAALAIASNAGNASSGQNRISLTGTGVSAGGTQSQTITFNAPVGPFYEGEQIALVATSTSGLPIEYLVTSGSGTILNNGTASATLKIAAAGNLTVTAFQFGNSQYAPATSVAASLAATQPVLTITATVPSLVVGTSLPSYTNSADYTVSGLIPGDAASVVTGQPVFTVRIAAGTIIPVGTALEAGTYTVIPSLGTLSFPSYYKPSFVSGTLTVTGVNQQTIDFTALPANITYNGATTYTLSAVAQDAVTGKADGLPISYAATGPATVSGNVLSVTGAGTVTVTATQAGGSDYASASASQTIQVAKATLTVTAVSLTYAQGVPLPALTSSSNYTITGLAPGDTLAAVTGQPALSVVDSKGLSGTPGAVLASGATPPQGVYSIQISAGYLSASNYNFNFVAGTLTVNSGTVQTINFPAISNVVYGAAPITLGATSTSGLAVSYAVSPTNIASLSGNVLSITGAGKVTVTVTQAGSSTYAPATPVQQTFTVVPAVLTVTANNATRVNDTPNPVFTYTITGFVNGDTQSIAVSGGVGLLTTATTTSSVGQYWITFDPGADTLAAANYTFNLVPGVLTITTGGPVPGYTIVATPQSIAVAQGQIAQAQITLSPYNYYQGLVNLSCGNLPKNVTCTFSPATLSATGNNAAVSTTLTINTNSASTIVGAIRPAGDSSIRSAGLYLPGALLSLLLVFARRRIARSAKGWQVLVFLAMLAGALGMTACGGSSTTNSTLAQTGNSTFTVTATDSAGAAVAQNLTISLTVR